MAIQDEGTGCTVTFATTGFAAYLLSVGGPAAERIAIETTHMGTTGSHTFQPGDLVSRTLDLEFAFDPSLSPPMHSAAETVTVRFPVPSGLTNGATWAASMFFTGYTPGAAIGERMTASATLQISGAVTITAAS